MFNNRDRWKAQLGLSVVEAAVVLVLVAIGAAVALPNLEQARGSVALIGVASELRGLMFRCRAWAIMKGRAAAVVFERKADGSYRCYLATDGDDDGIRRDDIEAGRDPIVGEVLNFEIGGAGLGILRDQFVPDPGGRGRLRGNLGDPVRAGRGDIITFTPRGTATPSSVYLTDHRSRMQVLRIYGATGRVISMDWRSGWPEWRASGK
ncbi:MAG: hypothetical protein ACC742_11625 [Thermoanaerobaculales bacterium]